MPSPTLSSCLVSLPILLLAAPAWAETLTVGPTGTFATPCAAFAGATDGDVVEIDAAGEYGGDVCAITANNLTIRGVGGRAKVDAAGNNAQGKGTWVVQGNDTTIENIELSGAAVTDLNGAGIRQEGRTLTVRNCFFHDNENGILAGDVPGSEILIEYSEFARNGAGDGYSHNLYVNHVAKLTFQFNYSHSALIGHLLKSRAAENYVLYNRITGESEGTQSYEINLPNGGKSYVIGNLIQQGSGTDNPNLLAYGEEGANENNPSDELFVISNTFVNDLGNGTFVSIGGATTTPAVLINNLFVGAGTITNQLTALVTTNSTDATCLTDAAGFDYRLVDGSSCVDSGSEPGLGSGFALAPQFHYVHPAQRESRAPVNALDVGAYELGGGQPGGDLGGASGFGGSGGNPASAGGTGTASGGSLSDETDNADSSGDGGCGCRTTRVPRTARGQLGLVLLALTLTWRRGRRPRLGAQ